MTTMEQLLKDRLDKFLKYKILKEEKNEKMFKALADSYLLQAKNLYKLINSKVKKEQLLKEEEEMIKCFFKDEKEKIKQKSDINYEKYFDWSENISKMSYMIIENSSSEKKTRNLYTCTNCGWIGKDEKVDKCPLCNKTEFKEY